jgi:hypothetical protein
MAETIIDSQDQNQNIQSGPEIVTDFMRKITTDQSLDTDTVTAIERLYRADKLTTTNLLKSLENTRGNVKHGSLTKT